jgi:serine/threonine protein kinase
VKVDFDHDFFDHYYLDKKLADGSIAQVRSLANLPTRANASDAGFKGRCAKIIDLRDKRHPGKACPEKQDLVAAEVHLWKSVGHHPNCAELVGAYMFANIGFVVMEKCHDSLYHHMKGMEYLNEVSLGELVHQMLSALQHLHSFRLVHGDVKPDNFLVGGTSGDTLKLCDFGLAAFLPNHGKLCGPVGTFPFMAPEMYAEAGYDVKADMWSLGVTVYAFLFGNFPYEPKDTQAAMMQAIASGRPPTFEPVGERKEVRSQEASEFARALLRPVAQDRPFVTEALDSSYIAMIRRHKNDGGLQSLARPSLHPMLKSARKVGVFTTIDRSLKTDLDDMVSVLQFQKLGLRMPDAWKSHQISMATASFGQKSTSSTAS